jgi:flagellin
MERLATGKANANAGDRSSYVAMADTFRLDFVGTKAGIKGASVVMGYLETGMRVLDSASGLLSRLQELAVLGANDTNTDADALAINTEAEAIAEEFDRLMTTSTYKGKDVFVAAAGGEYVSMGGRDSEMTFGIGTVAYDELYKGATADLRTISGGPNDTDATIGLRLLPSDAVATKKFGDDADNGFAQGAEYKLVTLGTMDDDGAGGADETDTDIVLIIADSDHTGDMAIGDTFTVDADATLANINALTKGATFERVSGTNDLTSLIEAVQAKVNTARVQAGSQYAALESAVNYTTDLTAQYELGYNVVNDVNFSMETAHLAKNQILQQAATAMLAQANQGQQGLLQLIS